MTLITSFMSMFNSLLIHTLIFIAFLFAFSIALIIFKKIFD